MSEWVSNYKPRPPAVDILEILSKKKGETVMNFRPLSDRVLVKRFNPPTQTPGGLTIPESAQEKQAKGEVLVVGPGRFLDDGRRLQMNVTPGQQILLSRFGGTEITIENEEYVILREDEILGVFDA